MKKNVLLIGIGPHAKRIYINYLKTHRVNLKLVVELESNKDKTIEYLNDLFSLIKFSDIFLNSRFKNDFLILGFFSFSSNLSITVCFKFKILITWLFK